MQPRIHDAVLNGRSTRRHHYQRGITYLQVSIAVIAFGLLTGMVLVGREFVKNAELQRVLTEKSSFVTAVNNFRDKYHRLPGDMNNATMVWGALNNVHATCIITPSVDKKTCNGDGDGTIGEWITNNQYYESFRFWQHLSNAGFLKETYTGAGLNGPNFLQAQPGLNVPVSKAIEGAGFGVYTRGIVLSADTDMFEGNYNHILFYGKQAPSSLPWSPVFSTRQAAQFDTKADDGLPGKGNIRNYKEGSGFNPNCTTTRNPNTSRYDLTTEEAVCSVIFVDVF